MLTEIDVQRINQKKNILERVKIFIQAKFLVTESLDEVK